MLSSSKEKSCSNSGIQENILLLFSEFKYILQNVDRRRRLFQKKLDWRVRHDRLSILICHEVFDILSDRRDTKTVLTSSLYKTKKKLGWVLILHNIPSFIDNKHTFFFTRTSDIPHIVQEDIHSNRTKDIIKISNRENHQSFFQIDIRWARKNSSKNSIYILIETFTESLSSIHCLENRYKVTHKWDFFSFCIIIFTVICFKE